MLSPQFPVPDTTRQLLRSSVHVLSLFPLNVFPNTLLLLELKISHPPVSSGEGLGLVRRPKFVMLLPVVQLPLAL